MGDPIQSSVRIRKAAQAISADAAIALLEAVHAEGYGFPQFGECDNLDQARDLLRAGEVVTFIADFSYGWSAVENDLDSQLSRNRDVVWFGHTEAKYEWSSTTEAWDGNEFRQRDSDHEGQTMLSSGHWAQICEQHADDVSRVAAVHAALAFVDPTEDAPQDTVLVT